MTRAKENSTTAASREPLRVRIHQAWQCLRGTNTHTDLFHLGKEISEGIAALDPAALGITTRHPARTTP